MHKFILICLSVLMLALLTYILLPIPRPGGEGVYNTISRQLWCNNESVCYHEVAHKMDQNHGWISGSEDFVFSLKVYLFSELRKDSPDNIAVAIMGYTFMPDGGMRDANSEAYAIIFQHSVGLKENMPEVFVEYYDWEMAEEYIEKYVLSP